MEFPNPHGGGLPSASGWTSLSGVPQAPVAGPLDWLDSDRDTAVSSHMSSTTVMEAGASLAASNSGGYFFWKNITDQMVKLKLINNLINLSDLRAVLNNLRKSPCEDGLVDII
ncbi:hypothetical protein EYZ11_010963 [Aspergillus tanneri]|uniref:Uncharacterized protein n=1 Tax=Aspergillus tanneri TaxID=1220188 RepID=A0A4S3J3Z7_9EURO|nr:hypothetical protein EYZ11_010963 [Aspergillus tanneri]